MAKSRFESLFFFIKRFHTPIIIVWLAIILASTAFIPSFFAATSYNLTDSASISADDSESQKTKIILEEQFTSLENQTDNNVILVIQSDNIYSKDIKKSLFLLNQTMNSDTSIKNFTGITSIYSIESDTLRAFIPEFTSQTRNLSSNIELLNKGLYDMQKNLTTIHGAVFDLKRGITQTSQMIYGIPMMYTSTWQTLSNEEQLDSYTLNQLVNKTILENTSYFNGDELTLGYYSLFVRMWNESFSNLSITHPLDRTQFAVNQSIALLQNTPLDITTKQLMLSVASGLTVTTWADDQAITDLTLNIFASQIPETITSYIGVSPKNLLIAIYNLTPTPTSDALSNLTIQLFTEGVTNNEDSFVGLIPGSGFDLSIPDFLESVYNLGSSPTDTLTWSLASSFLGNITSQSLSGSPLFIINEHSLNSLLLDLKTAQNVESVINNIVINQTIDNYPIIPSATISQNFVNLKNNTMIAILGFSSPLNSQSLSPIRMNIENSQLNENEQIYVTGTSVYSEDMSEIFSSVEFLTVIAGIMASLIIAGILFRSPIAAIFPLLIAGASILISYPAIYLGVVVIGGGTISFLTPILATLLMLGLGVDYSVILLRRTREERLAGKNSKDSVRVSSRWAGQAIITAGVAVITAYIVMAVAQVPMFSDVGVSIAIGVSILLIVSITLIPALEILLGDRLFWPGLKLGKGIAPKSKRITLLKLAEKTLKHKVPIAIGIGFLALGSLYIAQTTPTGMDFSKLLPDFSSNQGMTEIAENMGSGVISPVQILVTTPTPIVEKVNHFNQTLLDVIEQVTTTAKTSNGVSSVTSASQPFGVPFDYHHIADMSEPIRSQYLTSILDVIGKDNKTALITVGLANPPFSAEATSSLIELQSDINESFLIPGIEIHYGGVTQSIQESQSLLNMIFPQIVIILSAAIYILLLIQLKSAFTPIRLIYTILTSVAVSLALVYFVFYFTLNIPVVSFVPLFVAVTMLGVGIDYDIFLVTRIREEVLNGKSDNEAIKTAISKTGGTIMGLGLILASVFGSLMFTGIPILQEIGMAVAVAVIFDTFIVILFVVPALMGMAQRLNWWPSKPRAIKKN